MHAPIHHDVLTYAMFPTVTPQPISNATQLDNHHRATLTQRPTPRLRRALVNAFTALHGPMA
jgi:hypothetical protein